MGKKRKSEQSEGQPDGQLAARQQGDDERPPTKPRVRETAAAAALAGPSAALQVGLQGPGVEFKNKEKVLILSTRGITFRC